METTPAEEAARKKKTLLLLAGGAFSLILPLLGVLYLRWKDTRQAPRQQDAAVFRQREGAEKRITPPSSPAMAAAVVLTQPAAVPAAPPPVQGSLPMPAPSGKASSGGGSLGFIKGSDDYYADKKDEPKPEPKKEEAKPAPVEPAKPAPAKSTAKSKPGKKPFVMPRLQPGKGFTTMRRPGQQQEPAASDDDSPADMQELLKDIPGGASNPEVQKYLKQQGR